MPTLSGSLDITGSINTTGSINVTGSINTTGSFNITGSINATGSFNISGSMNNNGSPVITNAQTGSFVTNTQPGSFVTNTQTGSFVTNTQTGSFVTNAQTGSFVTNAQTGSFVTTGSNSFISGSMTITGSLTVSGSGTFTNIGPAIFSGSVTVVNGGVTGSLLGTASYATLAASASIINTSAVGSGTWFPLLKSSSSTGYYVPGAVSTFSLDFNTNTLTVTSSRAAAVPATGSNPASPSTGSIYFNPTFNLLYIYNGTTWRSASFS